MRGQKWEEFIGRRRRRKEQRRQETTNRRLLEDDPAVTNLLVSNLPEDCSLEKVWKEFRVFGNLEDVFLSKKKDKLGNRFAFIRFGYMRALKVLKIRSLLGEAKDIVVLCNLHSIVERFGFDSSCLKYIGGLKVILTFPHKTAMTVFLTSHKDSLMEWFKYLNPWEGKDIEFERIAWLWLSGVPIQLWDREVYDTIGNSFGTVVQSSNVSWKDKHLEHETVGVMEEWVPDFLTGNRKPSPNRNLDFGMVDSSPDRQSPAVATAADSGAEVLVAATVISGNEQTGWPTP
ncbi:hypothetical protein L1987_28034 [Smallanthus sonchifolius]|uniref:Uncharacterized protein n=1 Tax=Smallanthus sonchifolius TaxID=185202 RepID=A0ACB9IDT5_9ASTR|nr:hypothetical protein L1987_28034 [Smallanthus sonchifolius]